MSTEQNKATMRRFFEEAFNTGNVGILDEIIGDGYIGHDAAMPTPIIGIEGMTQVILGYRTAFPDIHFTVEAQVAENDLVTTRWVATGTNTGSLMGMPATGKAATVTGISLNRFVKDKTVELWASVDMMGMMQQLGVIPAPSH